MRATLLRVTLLLSFIFTAACATVPTSVPSPPTESGRLELRPTPGTHRLHFEVNEGQADARVQFLARASRYAVFLTSHDVVIVTAADEAVRLKLVGASPDTRPVGLQPLAGTANHFMGNDPAKWRRRVPTFGRVQYTQVYPGIDLVYHADHGQLEYDFVVAPGADPTAIRLAFEGVDKLTRDGAGNLVLHTRRGAIVQRVPVVYQTIDGARREIAGSYIVEGLDRIGFQVAEYDRTRPLIIDPILTYSTFLGGSDSDEAATVGVAVDAAGNAYVMGRTVSADFPITAGALPTGSVGAVTYVAKFDGAGQLVYSAALGGNQGATGVGIALDPGGNAYIAGVTFSSDFPTTAGAFQAMAGGGADLFVAKLGPTGSLVYSTFLGGSRDESTGLGLLGFPGIAVDGQGHAYVTGSTRSIDFPTTPGAAQTSFGGGQVDGFVTKLDAAGSAVYSTYLGGSDTDNPFGNVATDGSGNAYVVGFTFSPDFPATPGAFQPVFGGGPSDVFVTKLGPAGHLVYSTYLGGGANEAPRRPIADAAGNIYVIGSTGSTNFPTTPGAFATTRPGVSDGFVTKFDAAGAVVYSTYLGGSSEDEPLFVGVDGAGNLYVTGQTASLDFPTTPGATPSAFGGLDAFVTKFDPSGAVLYSTYLGGHGEDRPTGFVVDAAGHAFISGRTASRDFPTTAAAFGQHLNGGADVVGITDVFVTRLDPAGSMVYSTYLGAAGGDDSATIALDSAGNVYVTGRTTSVDFPITAGVFQTTHAGITDTFVAKISVNSASGSNVSVAAGNGVTVSFASVTASGETSADASDTGPTPPQGFSLDGAMYYEITTTATFAGPVTTCIAYDPAQFALPLTLRLFHFENGTWVDVTTSNDPLGGLICGQTASLSPFLIAEPAPVPVTIDIRPGSYPNNINLGSQGIVPVAIFSTATFDARSVDPATVTLASAPVKLKGKGQPMVSTRDVNGDGRVDLVVDIETDALELSSSDTDAILKGSTFGGQRITGSDSVRVVPQ